MIPIRTSTALSPNSRLALDETKRELSNREWLEEVEAGAGVILLGGATLSHFRVRYAQSGARSDLTPSHWSICGVLLDRDRFLSVPLDGWTDAAAVPVANGIRECSLADYDDPARFPNIAVVSFGGDAARIAEIAQGLMLQRSVIDLPDMMVPWLAYLWDADGPGNPLAAGIGLPSAAFVEVVYGVAGVELTPALSSSSSCPEAIWQSAKWWHEFYAEATARPSAAALSGDAEDTSAAGEVPSGYSLVRQPVAAPSAPIDPAGSDRVAAPGAREAAMTAARTEGHRTKSRTRPARKRS